MVDLVRHLVAALCPQGGFAMGGRTADHGEQQCWASLSLVCGDKPAGAHPHVWITTVKEPDKRSTPDGKVSAVIHDWVLHR